MHPEFSVTAQNFQFGASLKMYRRHSQLRTFVLFSFVKPSTVAVTHTASNSQPLLKMRTFSCFVAVNSNTALLNGEFIQKCEFCREFCFSPLTFFFSKSLSFFIHTLKVNGVQGGLDLSLLQNISVEHTPMFHRIKFGTT